jgi:hypothetical protein
VSGIFRVYHYQLTHSPNNKADVAAIVRRAAEWTIVEHSRVVAYRLGAARSGWFWRRTTKNNDGERAATEYIFV